MKSITSDYTSPVLLVAPMNLAAEDDDDDDDDDDYDPYEIKVSPWGVKADLLCCLTVIYDMNSGLCYSLGEIFGWRRYRGQRL